MSYRRSLSFSENERHLLSEFDTNGKSDFAKDAMKFFIKYRDKLVIASENYVIKTNDDLKIKVNKLFKK